MDDVIQVGGHGPDPHAEERHARRRVCRMQVSGGSCARFWWCGVQNGGRFARHMPPRACRAGMDRW